MRLYELIESKEVDDKTREGNLSPFSSGHKKTIDIIGLASLLGRNLLRLGQNGDNAKKCLRQVGMYRPELETALTRLGKDKGPDGCCKNEILNWIEYHEPETNTELQVKQLDRDPCSGEPNKYKRKTVGDNDEGRLSPISGG
jgi:hypothetical protein